MAEYLLGTNGPTPLDIKRIAVSASSSGDNTVINAVTGKRIRVLSGHLVAAGSVNVIVKSGSTALTGAMPFAANTAMDLHFDPLGHFETAAGQALVFNLSGAVSVAGWLNYIER